MPTLKLPSSPRGRTASLLTALLTAGAALLAGAPNAAAASIGQAASPPSGQGYLVAGPGCPNTSVLSTGSSGGWKSISAGDYAGPVEFGGSSAADGSCSNKTAYILTTTSQTAQFRWHFYDAVSYYWGYKTVCSIYAYVPTANAGDQHARYDFWGDDGNGNLTWEAWPGQNFNQENMSAGWYYIGTAVQPAGTYRLTISLSNADASNPGWDAGAGAMAVACNEDPN